MSRRSIDELQAHLFDQLNRLGNPDLTPDQLREEIARAGAIGQVAREIIAAGDLQIRAEQIYSRCKDAANLACITRADLARLNQQGWSALRDPALRRAAIAAVQVQTRAHQAARRLGLPRRERVALLATPRPFAAHQDA